jgi:hypothetical protein
VDRLVAQEEHHQEHQAVDRQVALVEQEDHPAADRQVDLQEDTAVEDQDTSSESLVLDMLEAANLEETHHSSLMGIAPKPMPS